MIKLSQNEVTDMKNGANFENRKLGKNLVNFDKSGLNWVNW